MPTDAQLLYHHTVENREHIDIAKEYGLSVDSVRSRISRASRKVEAPPTSDYITRLDRYSIPLLQNPQQDKQNAIIEQSKNTLSKHLKKHPSGTIAWLGDIHFPYANHHALSIAYRIIEDVKPNIITALNDELDSDEHSKWDNPTTPAAELWTSNIDNPINLVGEHHSILRSASPLAILLGVPSNHDKRIFDYLRRYRTGFTEHNVTYFMQELYAQGVLQFSNRDRKSVV